MLVIGFEETSIKDLSEAIHGYFASSGRKIKIISVNYSAFQTNNYADHLYSALIFYKEI